MHITAASSLRWITPLETIQETRDYLLEWKQEQPSVDLLICIKVLEEFIAKTEAYQKSEAYQQYLESLE